MSHSVLIVDPNAFSMGWRGATPRTMDLAEGLVRRGWDVPMLTRRLSLSVDHSSLEIAFPGRIIRTPFSGAYVSWMDTHDFLRRLNRGLWKLKGKVCYQRAFQCGWAARTARWAPRAWRGKRPDVLSRISSLNLMDALAGHYVSRVFGCSHVLGLRPPPIYRGCDFDDPRLSRSFRKCLRASSAVVTTMESYASCFREAMVRLFGPMPSRLRKTLTLDSGSELNWRRPSRYGCTSPSSIVRGTEERTKTPTACCGSSS